MHRSVFWRQQTTCRARMKFDVQRPIASTKQDKRKSELAALIARIGDPHVGVFHPAIDNIVSKARRGKNVHWKIMEALSALDWDAVPSDE